MYILGFIVLFLIIGFFIGLLAKEEVAYGLILIITIAWAFIFGPWAIATFIELAIGYSLGAKLASIDDNVIEKTFDEAQDEEGINFAFWIPVTLAGGMFLLTQILNYSNS